MSQAKFPIHLLQELENLTEIVNSPLQSAQRIKYSCLDVSKTLIAFGATSGGIYVFNRQPCEFIQLIPSKDGAITRLSISPDEKHICFANGRGVVTVTECEPNLSGGRKSVTCKEHQGNEVTCIMWGGRGSVYTGDDVGRVCVTMVHNFLPKNIFQNSQTIMSLDSRICQLDTKDVMLLVSTLSRCYICDTSQEQYRQIGQKLRDGEYGACFVTKERAIENGIVNDLTDNRGEVKKYNIVNGNETFAVNEKLLNTFIYCARPSSRLWEANITGTVERTHQYKQALSRKPSKIISKVSYENGNVIIEPISDENEGISINFPKTYSIKNSTIFSFKKDALYFLDLTDIDNTIWFDHFKDINDCKLYNDTIYIWLQSGSLYSLRYMRIDKYVLKCYLDEKFLLCCNLCALYSDYFLSENSRLNNKLSILSDLKHKLNDESLMQKIDDVLAKFCTLKDKNAKENQPGIKTVQNLHQTQKLLSDNEEEEDEMNSNKHITFKDLSSTMTDKLNTSKKILKEKWDDLEGKFKNLATEIQVTDGDVNKKVIKDNIKPKQNEISKDLQNELPLDNGDIVPSITNDTEHIIYKDSSQMNIEQINEIAEENSQDSESDKLCKALYHYHKLSVINDNKNAEQLQTILAIYNSNIKEIYNLMLLFEEHCIRIGALNEAESAPNDIFLFYINTSKERDKIINEIIIDEDLYKYFVDSCIAVNSKSQKDSNFGCECGYPLPFVKTNLTPKYSELIDEFIEKQWSNKSTKECYEVCKKMPYLWRRIIHLRRNEDLQNLLKILLQILDETILHSFLPQFTIETWEKAIQLYAVLQCNECLNCGKKFDHISVKKTLNWDDIGGMVIKSIGAKNALKIMEKYSKVIDKGELSMRFYHGCLLVCLFEKFDGTIKGQLLDTVYACNGNSEAIPEICSLLRSTTNSTLKNTSLPIIVAVQSNHWGLETMHKDIIEIKQNNLKLNTQNNSQNLLEKAQNITMNDLLGYLKNESGNTDCNLCGLPVSNEVLIQDGGLWVFKCGHIFHGACLELNKIKLCPSCK